MEGWVRHRWSSVYLQALALAALMLFLYGFFPIKYHSGQIAHWDDLPSTIHDVRIDGQTVYTTEETSVVLMVIDALRYDFATEEYMPFTSALLKNRSACKYISMAEPPTVTMPRIKAMMTGSVSTFADVALNFGAPAVAGDSVLRAAASRGRRSHLYGDDTWLRLFPGLWADSDGTTSFYVTDYTEVDNNVTRHLDRVLAPDDKGQPVFDFLVLHYLGLDHIGHLEGARSPKIKPKLKEMDDVIMKIYSAMGKWERAGVLLICGDHGMRDAGGHGGASPAELLVPLVVARTPPFQCPHDPAEERVVSQVDVAPSVAWLVRAPAPGDSVGRLLPALLPADPRQQLYLLHYTAARNAAALAKQLGQSVAHDKECYKQFRRAEQLFAQYLRAGQAGAANAAGTARHFYEQALDEMSRYLAESTVDFDMFAILLAVCLLYAILISLAMTTLYSMQASEHRRYSVSYHHHRSQKGAVVAFTFISLCVAAILVIACAITETKSSLCHCLWNPNGLWIVAFALIAMTFSGCFFIIKIGLEKTVDLSAFSQLNLIDLLLIFGTLIHALTFVGTSFIEEEHQTWYFFWNTLMFFVLVRTLSVLVSYVKKRMDGATEVQDKPLLHEKMTAMGVGMLPKWVLLIGLHRFLRTLNQTGDRWAFLPDTADWLNEPHNATYLHALMMTGIIATCLISLWNLRYTNNMLQMNTALTIAAALCSVAYRMATHSLPPVLPAVARWDPYHIINVFWGLLAANVAFELVTYIGRIAACVSKADKATTFLYHKPKEKIEDYNKFAQFEDAPGLEDVKLRLSRSVTHLTLNNMMMIVTMLMRPHNVILVPSVYVTCVLTSRCLGHGSADGKEASRSEVLDVVSQSLAHFWIGSLFFFYQGNSNSLASVDLGAGYVGLREYSPTRVALRMGLHAYAGPALAGVVLLCTLAARAPDWDQFSKSVWRAMNVMALTRVYSVAVYLCIATGFRHHLFVWTVFSPKLLYDLVATTFTLAALLTVAAIFALTHLTNWFSRAVTFRTNL